MSTTSKALLRTINVIERALWSRWVTPDIHGAFSDLSLPTANTWNRRIGEHGTWWPETQCACGAPRTAVVELGHRIIGITNRGRLPERSVFLLRLFAPSGERKGWRFNGIRSNFRTILFAKGGRIYYKSIRYGIDTVCNPFGKVREEEHQRNAGRRHISIKTTSYRTSCGPVWPK